MCLSYSLPKKWSKDSIYHQWDNKIMAIKISQILHYIFYALYPWPFSYLSLYFIFDQFQITPQMWVEGCMCWQMQTFTLPEPLYGQVSLPICSFIERFKVNKKRNIIPKWLCQRLWSIWAHMQNKAGPDLCIFGHQAAAACHPPYWSAFSLIAFLLLSLSS